MDMFESFSDNLRAKIEQSPEWQARQGNQSAKAASTPKGSGFDDMDDDIPF
jgi:single-stranded DNA-binding protein